MFVPGQLVAVRRTGAYGNVVKSDGYVVIVRLDSGRVVRFDRSSLEHPRFVMATR